MKAIFLDRDGVINELIYYQEQGIVDSPFTVEQFRIIPGVTEAIQEFRRMEYTLILISNQPGIAKGHLSLETFQQISQKMRDELAKQGAHLDGEYYCRHHPQASIKAYKADCSCRKPQPDLLYQAARERDIDLAESWMIGDSLTDVRAGNSAGCHTILIGRMKCELCRLMDDEGARPEVIAADLLEAAHRIRDVLDQESCAPGKPGWFNTYDI